MMKIQTDIQEIVKKYIGIDAAVNQFDDSLVDLGMDSIMFIHIVVELEEKFAIEIPDEKLLISEMDTMNKMLSIITALVEGSCN